ncbi:MAG: histidinol-phosphate transaminase [Candidatus Methanoplasma sp.]|jgi:histidinol-phosphate aminotransferase|nr:histidinol-phosphate transaminase [Candidatus Methanoplasma sp.]
MMASRDVMRSTTRGFRRYYNPEVGGELRMDTNTNVLGSNPAAEKYIREQREDINGYPNTYSDGLRDALASLYGLERENFVAGSGSDEMLDVSFKTFTEWGDGCVMPVPSYSLYDYFIKMSGGKPLASELTEDFQLDVDDMVRSGAKVAIVPSPNNPTGNSFRQKDLEDLLRRFGGIVVIDEAYGEYSDSSMISRVGEFDNLVILRTFSKAYAMAGLRVGYAAASLDLADMMNSVKIPYSLNKIGEGAAIAAVKDQEFIERSKKMVAEERPKLAAELRKLNFGPYPSDANFILAASPIDHSVLVSELKKKGVMIRDFGDKRRTENCVRMTVGTAELNKIMTDRISEVLEEFG